MVLVNAGDQFYVEWWAYREYGGAPVNINIQV